MKPLLRCSQKQESKKNKASEVPHEIEKRFVNFEHYEWRKQAILQNLWYDISKNFNEAKITKYDINVEKEPKTIQ